MISETIIGVFSALLILWTVHFIIWFLFAKKEEIRQFLLHKLGARTEVIQNEPFAAERFRNGEGEFYSIRYMLDGLNYKVVFPYPSITSAKKFYVTEGDSSAVTSTVLEYLGPCNNFHGLSIKVSDLGFSKLMFHFIDKKPKIFEKDDVLPNDLSGLGWNMSL
jgi:hypothetical protein